MIYYKFVAYGNWEIRERWGDINKIVNSLKEKDIYISVRCYSQGFANYIELIAGDEQC